VVVRSGRWYYPVEYVVQANSLRLGKKRTQLENGIHAVARDVPAAAARGVDVVEARGRTLHQVLAFHVYQHPGQHPVVQPDETFAVRHGRHRVVEVVWHE
jgi:hypothetical protein